MKQFTTDIHPLGDYNIQFSRIDINNDLMINRIIITNKISNNTLVDIKMDFSTTKALNRYLKLMINNKISGFNLDIPSYNTIEVCRIEGNILDYYSIELVFKFENTDNNVSEIKLVLSNNDFIKFSNLIFFFLLIDLVSDPFEK